MTFQDFLQHKGTGKKVQIVVHIKNLGFLSGKGQTGLLPKVYSSYENAQTDLRAVLENHPDSEGEVIIHAVLQRRLDRESSIIVKRC